MKVYEIIANEGILAKGLGALKGLAKNSKGVAAATLPAVASGKTDVMAKTSKLLGLFTTLGLGLSVNRYFQHMKANKQELDSGSISKEEFDSRRQAEVAVLTESIVATLAAHTITLIALGPIRLILGFIPGTSGLVSLLHLTDEAAGAAVIAYLNTTSGRELLAKTLTLPIIGQGIETVFGAGPEYIYSQLEAGIRSAIGAPQNKYAPGNYDKFKKPSTGVDSTSGDSAITLPSNDASIRAGWQAGSGFAKTTD